MRRSAERTGGEFFPAPSRARRRGVRPSLTVVNPLPQKAFPEYDRSLPIPRPGLSDGVYCGSHPAILRETVALGRFAVHSNPMSDSGSDVQYFWCIRHHRTETGADVCPARYVLGPYASATDAEQALQRVRQRNEAWDAEDARWAGEER